MSKADLGPIHWTIGGPISSVARPADGGIFLYFLYKNTLYFHFKIWIADVLVMDHL